MTDTLPDLAAVFDAHMAAEFATRDTDGTVATSAAEAGPRRGLHREICGAVPAHLPPVHLLLLDVCIWPTAPVSGASSNPGWRRLGQKRSASAIPSIAFYGSANSYICFRPNPAEMKRLNFTFDGPRICAGVFSWAAKRRLRVSPRLAPIFRRKSPVITVNRSLPRLCVNAAVVNRSTAAFISGPIHTK